MPHHGPSSTMTDADLGMSGDVGAGGLGAQQIKGRRQGVGQGRRGGQDRHAGRPEAGSPVRGSIKWP